MKKLIILLLFIIIILNTYSQNIAITDDNAYTADPSAMLDVKSLTKGLLIPRMTTVQRTSIVLPATGLLVYDTNESVFYYYTGSVWSNLSYGQLWTKNNNYIYLSNTNNNVGIGVTSPENKLLVKADITTGIDESIFAVLNTNGDTVFAVYNEGVRIWVDDNGGTKANGNRGGFAVGGFNPTKAGFTNEYLRVTPDSVWVYINDDYTGTKANGNRGGFAVGGFNPTKGTFSDDYLFVQDDSTRIYTGDTMAGFGVQNIGATSKTSYMNLTPNNYFIGHEAGFSITGAGNYNSFIGYNSGRSNSSGNNNVFLGYKSGYSNTVGFGGVFLGTHAGFSNTNGTMNTFVGDISGYSNLGGSNNCFIGNESGFNNLSGSQNVFIGFNSGYSNIDGGVNCFLGKSAGSFVDHGDFNTFVGGYAGQGCIGGNYNTSVGYLSFSAVQPNWDNITCLGFNAQATGNNRVCVGNTSINWIGGQVGWSTYSDGRFKTNISDNVPGLDFIDLLHPVTYNYDPDEMAKFFNTPDSLRLPEAERIKRNTIYTGFIAQEVDEAAKRIGFDFSGVCKPENENDFYSLRYSEFTVPLVKSVQELHEIILELKQENDRLNKENLEFAKRLEKLESRLDNYN